VTISTGIWDRWWRNRLLGFQLEDQPMTHDLRPQALDSGSGMDLDFLVGVKLYALFLHC
jgi:hypothetical protein